jgi:hypothetical protein
VEWNRGRQCVITAAFHVVGPKPSEASHCRRGPYMRQERGKYTLCMPVNKVSTFQCEGHSIIIYTPCFIPPFTVLIRQLGLDFWLPGKYTKVTESRKTERRVTEGKKMT